MIEFLEPVLFHSIIPRNTSFSVDINSPSKSLKGVLLIFTKERSTTKFNRNTEEFFKPKVTKVEVTAEGSRNELYAQNMEYCHQYDERLKDAGAIYPKRSTIAQCKYSFVLY